MADAGGTAEPAFMNVPIGRSLKSCDGGSWTSTAAPGGTPARCIWTPRIARQALLAGGATIGAVGDGRAEGEHSPMLLCRTCHVQCSGEVHVFLCIRLREHIYEEARMTFHVCSCVWVFVCVDYMAINIHERINMFVCICVCFSLSY